MLEEWKDIHGFEGLYQVSNLGRVRSLDRVTLTARGSRKYRGKLVYSKPDSSTGYCRVALSCPTSPGRDWTHRLVAREFLPNHENKKYVNHINGVKTDNRADNLEWCTALENNVHAINELPRKKNTDREKCIQFKPLQVLDVRKRFSLGETALMLAKRYNVDRKTIDNIVKRRTWKTM